MLTAFEKTQLFMQTTQFILSGLVSCRHSHVDKNNVQRNSIKLILNSAFAPIDIIYLQPILYAAVKKENVYQQIMYLCNHYRKSEFDWPYWIPLEEICLNIVKSEC